MKSGSGSPTTSHSANLLFSQPWWRKVGGASIVLAALMAWFGAEAQFVRGSLIVFCVYWGIFGALFLIALLMVILDLRYIRLQYVLGKREIFQQTLGDEDFRKSLKKEMRTRAHGRGSDDRS